MSRQAAVRPGVAPAGAVGVGSVRAGPAALFDRVLLWLALAAFSVTGASWLARTAWLFELFTHFRFQLAAGAVLLLAAALVRRRARTAALALLVMLANGMPLLPYLSGGIAEAATTTPAALELMTANVHYRNADYAALLEQVRREDPDVLGLLEVDQRWLDALAPLEAEYRWRVQYPQPDPWGLALYSKLPVEELAVSPYREAGVNTAILVKVEVGDTPVTLALAHVSAPTTPGKARLRNLQLGRLAELLSDREGPRILAGDLNITPWSPYYQDLAAAAGLTNAARGVGYLPTWPAGFNPFKIPIDHCLVSDEVRVVSFRTGATFNSDHLPVLVQLVPEGGLRAE